MDGRDGRIRQTGQDLPPIEACCIVGGHVRDTSQHFTLEAIAHFGRRLLGEGDGQDPSRWDPLPKL